MTGSAPRVFFPLGSGAALGGLCRRPGVGCTHLTDVGHGFYPLPQAESGLG